MTRKSPIFLLPMKYFTFQWRFAWAMSGGSQRSLLRRERGSTRPYVGRNNTDGFDPVGGGRTRPAFDGARVRPRSCCDYGGVVRNHHGNLSGTHLGCFGFLGQCKPDPPSPWVVLVPPVSGTAYGNTGRARREPHLRLRPWPKSRRRPRTGCCDSSAP